MPELQRGGRPVPEDRHSTLMQGHSDQDMSSFAASITTPGVAAGPLGYDSEEACHAIRNRVQGRELAAKADAHTEPLSTPVEQCFDWAVELRDLVRGAPAELYVVVFRSVRKASADSLVLYRADAAAHAEALLSGGLLKYWYGVLNERRECLAMCIWASREDAVKAVHKPAHRVAMKLAGAMYDMYSLEKYLLKIDENLVPSFTLLGSMSS